MTRLLAPAKLTTSLRILGRRSDGFHLLDAEMVSLDLCDELEVIDGEEGLEVRDEVAWRGLPGTAPADAAQALDLPPGSNLVERALASCERQARCILTKRIPSAAGLGGASADAAAILRWAGISDLEVASRLGADVPFCLVGGRARVRGIGEQVEPFDPAGVDDSAFLLVTPRLTVSTSAVYASWDELGGPSGENGNDLEPAALAAYPGLRWWRDLMGAAIGERPRLAGSGGTWFVEGRAEPMAMLADQIRAEIVAGRESVLVVVARGSDAMTAE